jgi:hypothetical protein
MTDIDHLTQIANDRLGQIRRLEREVDAWRDTAGQLHAALAASTPGVFPGPGDSSIRCAALESYARLKTGFNSYEL